LEKKLTFAVENIELMEESNDSQFATLRIDAFASGKNRHNLYISEDTLSKTSKTILQKPIVWTYNRTTDDATTHGENQLICGFIPQDSPIDFRKLEDGRTMMSVMGKLWTRYSGRMMEIFSRDKTKSVSVEMEVFETLDNSEFSVPEITSFCYQCITVLGEMVTPAIPLAKADLMEFAKKESEDYSIALLEYSSRYETVDLSIPKKVKANADKGLELYKAKGKGGTSVSLATARFLSKSDKITPDKVRKLYTYLEKHVDSFDENDTSSNNYISWMLWGGKDGLKWGKKLIDVLSELDSKRMSYFSEEATNKNMGFESQEEESNMDDKEEEKKEEMATEPEKKEEMAAEPEKEKETPAEEKKEEDKEKKENPEEEKKETPEDEKKEEKKEEMSLDSNLDLAAILEMLKSETEDYQSLVHAYSGETTDFKMLCSAMFSKMKEMSEKVKAFDKMKTDNEAYMSENEDLKKFKSDIYAEKFSYEVEHTLQEVSDTMPKAELDLAREESLKYSLENVDAWKNLVKAKAFTFSKSETKNDGIVRMGLPFTKGGNTRVNSPWKR